MQFPTGGIAREPYGMIRSDSGADSTVWMEEDTRDTRESVFMPAMQTPWNLDSGAFYIPSSSTFVYSVYASSPNDFGLFLFDAYRSVAMESKFMLRALELAKQGCGNVSPNPLVGAVIVKDGRIIGEGFHETYGGLHAERNALLDCRTRGESASGADIYVTLEPCCHHGKQPPCTDALIEAGLRRVYVGSRDPNPLVSGKGIAILRSHGIEVEEQILREACDAMNVIFFHYIRTGLPFVLLKYAMSLDGKIACSNGASRWITGEQARRHVHETRNRYASVMVGINTVLADDPSLSCRIPGGRNPIRIVCDSSLRIPLHSALVQSASDIRTIIACCEAHSAEKRSALEQRGCEILVCGKAAQVDLAELFRRLGEKQIDSVLLEGGATLAWSALSLGLVNRVHAYIAPKLIGGVAAPSPLGGCGVKNPSDAFRLVKGKLSTLGSDLLLEGDLEVPFLSCGQDPTTSRSRTESPNKRPANHSRKEVV